MVTLFQMLSNASYSQSLPELLLFSVALPFLLIFVVVWGGLTMTKIFGTGPDTRKMYIVLALVIAIITTFTDAWGFLATQLAAFSGVMAYAMFFTVFILGMIIYAIGTTRKIHYAHKVDGVAHDEMQKLKRLKDIDKELDRMYKRYKHAEIRGEYDRAGSYAKSIEQLEKRKEQIINNPRFAR